MIFLYVYIGFSLLTFLLIFLQLHTFTNQMLKKYSEQVDKSKKDNLASFFVIFKLFVQSFIPILNIALFCIIIFYGDKLTEVLTKEIDNKMDEKTN